MLLAPEVAGRRGALAQSQLLLRLLLTLGTLGFDGGDLRLNLRKRTRHSDGAAVRLGDGVVGGHLAAGEDLDHLES